MPWFEFDLKKIANTITIANIVVERWISQIVIAMSRISPFAFNMVYKVQFNGPIRGHHIYNETWIPHIGMKVICHPDPREVAIT